MPEEIKCYAPTFPPGNCWSCMVLTIIYAIIIVALILTLIIAIIGGPDALRKVLCLIKQYRFMIANCRKGNSDPNIVL